MSTKDLEKAGSGALDLPPEMLAEMEAASQEAKSEIDLRSDIRLPSLMLVQATTQVESDAKPGQILDTMTGTAYDEVEVIPAIMFKSRAYFGSGSIGDPPTCSSPDALNGYGNIAEKLIKEGHKGPAGESGDCQVCPQANWRTGGKCQLRFNYLAVVIGDEDLETSIPRGVMMHGTSAKVASRLNTMLIGQKFFWGSTIKLSSTSEKNEKGKYSVWNVTKGRPCTNEELVLAFKLNKQIAASRAQGSVTITDEPEDADKDIPF